MPEQDDQKPGQQDERNKSGDGKREKREGEGQDNKDGDKKNGDKKDENSPEEKRKKRRTLIIFAVVLVIAAVTGLIYWLHSRNFEDTDDAQVDGNLSPIGSRINGTISRVYVENNQEVKIGDLLVDLDPRDNQASVDQSAAQVAQAQSELDAERPNVPITRVQTTTNVSTSDANVAAQEAAVEGAAKDRDQDAAKVVSQQAATEKAEKDLKRYSLLLEKQEVSKQDYDQYLATAQQQEATLEAMKATLESAKKNVDQQIAKLNQTKAQLKQNQDLVEPQRAVKRANVRQKEANLQSARAQLGQSQLNLSYTKIYAPVSGIVMKRAAQVGARVSAGQQLLTISEIGNLWITANLKETQLRRVRSGQRVVVYVDALDRKFNGTIFTIGGATGSIASTLPPENATGNYVKVVQRVPVRINLDRDQDGYNRLRPGMSAQPKVQVE